MFFRELENVPTDLSQLDAEDFHCRNIADPIRITVIFTDLGVEAQGDFASYYRQEKLIVSAVATFDDTTGKAEVKLELPRFRGQLIAWHSSRLLVAPLEVQG